MPGCESSDSNWSDTKARRESNGVNHEKLKRIDTIVHSTVSGGVSVHNALMALKSPPPDSKPGSKDAPWLRLTDWEMMMLRKRMKKNAKWRPSESMVKVELINFGRGPHNYWETKKKAEAEGVEFLDVDNIAEANPDKPRAWGEVSLTAPSSSEDIPRNKGMALNEAKKRKRDELASQRNSRNISDDGLQPLTTPAVMLAGRVFVRKAATKVSQVGSKAHSNVSASAELTRVQPYRKTDESQTSEDVKPDDSLASYVTKQANQSRTPMGRENQRRFIPEAASGSSRHSLRRGEQGGLTINPLGNSPAYTDPSSEPFLERPMLETRNNMMPPNPYPTNLGEESKKAGVSQLSRQSSATAIFNSPMSSGLRSSMSGLEQSMLHQSDNPSSTSVARTHTTTSPQPSSATTEMPLNIATFLRRSYDHTRTSPQSPTMMLRLQQPQQLNNSPSTVGLANATDYPQMPRPKARFDHRESLSRIIGNKPPVMKTTHQTVKPRPVFGPPPPMIKHYSPPNASSATKAPSATKPSPATNSSSAANPSSAVKAKPGPKPKAKPGPKPKARPGHKPKAKPGPKPKAKPGPKPKVKPGPKPKASPNRNADSQADKPPPKKRKYIPGGPGGGGRYVAI